jgi:MFS family permease
MDTPTQTQAVATAAPSLVRARLAVSAAFFIAGCGLGLWAVHIPIVVDRLGISAGTLGLALLSAAVGSVGTMPLTGLLLARRGSRLPTASLALAFAVLIPLPVLAPSISFLFVSLFFFGAAMGGLDVAMNTQAAEVEAMRGRPTMSSFHGFFSLGALAGATLGGFIIGAGWGNGSGAVATAVVLFALAVWAAMNLWPSGRPVDGGPRFALPPAALWGLGAITFLAFAGEGGVVDWSALFLATVKRSSEAEAASGLAAFSVAMVVFRLTGDWLVARLGNVATVVGGGVLMAVGIGIAILAPTPFLSAAGFAVVGIGAANLVPVAFSAATRVPGVSPGIGVAAVTTTGYGGFLIFPPILGFAAQAWGLSASMLIVAAMGLAIIAFAGAVRR